MLYKIKASKDLYDKWTKLAKKTTKKMPSISIIQNDMEVPKKELSDWFKESMEEIIKVDQDYKETIQEMLKLRMEIMEYLKEQIS